MENSFVVILFLIVVLSALLVFNKDLSDFISNNFTINHLGKNYKIKIEKRSYYKIIRVYSNGKLFLTFEDHSHYELSKNIKNQVMRKLLENIEYESRRIKILTNLGLTDRI